MLSIIYEKGRLIILISNLSININYLFSRENTVLFIIKLYSSQKDENARELNLQIKEINKVIFI